MMNVIKRLLGTKQDLYLVFSLSSITVSGLDDFLTLSHS